MLDLKVEYATHIDASDDGYIEIHQTYGYGGEEDAMVMLSAAQARKLLDALPYLIEKLEG